MQTHTRPGPQRRGESAAVDPNATFAGTRHASGRARRAYHSHPLSDQATEAIARWLVRIVPLIFGVVLGGLAEDLAIGMAGAVAVSVAFDLSMEKHSIILNLYHRARRV